MVTLHPLFVRTDTTVTMAPSMVLSRAQTEQPNVPRVNDFITPELAVSTAATANSSESTETTQTMKKILTMNSQPPPLAYTLSRKKIAILICWLLVFVDSVGLAICLYFPLVYAANLELWEVMTIVTCLVGMISLVQYVWRAWVLVAQERFRPIGGTKWQFDMFHWVYTIGIILVTLELVLGTIPDEPIMGLCSMPLATTLFVAAIADLTATAGYFMKIKLPFRVSSLARGELARPGVYTIIEDVVAVDGHGELDYRHALDNRYRASEEFRNLLAKMSLFWSIPAMIVGAVTTAVVWTASDSVAFAVGWSVPFVWAMLWTMVTVPVVKKALKRERDVWAGRGVEGVQ